MSYSVDISPKADKQLDKLEKSARDRIFETLDRVRLNPWRHAEKAVGSPYYRFRAGDYRIIADIKEERLIILVIEVAHRSIVYRFYEERAKYKAESRARIKQRIIG